MDGSASEFSAEFSGSFFNLFFLIFFLTLFFREIAAGGASSVIDFIFGGRPRLPVPVVFFFGNIMSPI